MADKPPSLHVLVLENVANQEQPQCLETPLLLAKVPYDSQLGAISRQSGARQVSVYTRQFVSLYLK